MIWIFSSFKMVNPKSICEKLDRRLSAVLGSRIVILNYHHVLASRQDLFNICVAPKNFEAHLEFLKRRYRVLGLSELLGLLKIGKIPHRAVVLTFDDGYSDNYLNAVPLLEKYRMPATFFVTTQHLDTLEEFWWDGIQRLALSLKKFPEKVHLEISGEDCELALGSSPEPTLRLLSQKMYSLEEESRRRLLQELFRKCGVRDEPRAEYRCFSSEELFLISKNPLFEMGAHTVSHRSLKSLPLETQRMEILASKKCLEEIIQKTIRHFAYPFGTPEHYTPETQRLVQACGFKSACTVGSSAVNPDSPLFGLCRLAVGDGPATSFSQKLAECFHS
ncbi:MAG: polysaccharide deacetylase family protein [Candidatus Omnitrophica bacterium]|nr:polysaccharide deacetylase family protein [Candidatus Omnitrophota bacterium]